MRAIFERVRDHIRVLLMCDCETCRTQRGAVLVVLIFLAVLAAVIAANTIG
jgi:hypothetical protein